MVELIRQVY